ncbi:unnamed protein product, partial [Amoebophrya sp. A25]
AGGPLLKRQKFGSIVGSDGRRASLRVAQMMQNQQSSMTSSMSAMFVAQEMSEDSAMSASGSTGGRDATSSTSRTTATLTNFNPLSGSQENSNPYAGTGLPGTYTGRVLVSPPAETKRKTSMTTDGPQQRAGNPSRRGQSVAPRRGQSVAPKRGQSVAPSRSRRAPSLARKPSTSTSKSSSLPIDYKNVVETEVASRTLSDVASYSYSQESQSQVRRTYTTRRTASVSRGAAPSTSSFRPATRRDATFRGATSTSTVSRGATRSDDDQTSASSASSTSLGMLLPPPGSGTMDQESIRQQNLDQELRMRMQLHFQSTNHLQSQTRNNYSIKNVNANDFVPVSTSTRTPLENEQNLEEQRHFHQQQQHYFHQQQQQHERLRANIFQLEQYQQFRFLRPKKILMLTSARPTQNPWKLTPQTTGGYTPLMLTSQEGLRHDYKSKLLLSPGLFANEGHHAIGTTGTGSTLVNRNTTAPTPSSIAASVIGDQNNFATATTTSTRINKAVMKRRSNNSFRPFLVF